MGEFNKRHLDLITYSSICHAKTVLDLYTGNINKNIRITYIPFCYLKSLKIKQKQNDTVCDKFKRSVTSCKKHVIFTIISKGVKNILMSSDY